METSPSQFSGQSAGAWWSVETGYSAAVERWLSSRGHRIKWGTYMETSVQGECVLSISRPIQRGTERDEPGECGKQRQRGAFVCVKSFY